ncbi:MAG: hypothetical protein GXN95_06310 [Methanococci archaeon]|nr:hypothetical protein [Methanococci archaeon]
MNQKREIELLMFEVLPYISNISYIKEIFEEAESLEDLERKVEELLKVEKDITKKTDLKILLEKIKEAKEKSSNLL